MNEYRMTNDTRQVVFISQRYPPEQGGNASRIRDLAVNIHDEGWDVTVLSPVKSYPFGEFGRSSTRHTVESQEGITIHRLWTWQPQMTDPSLHHRLAYYLIFALHAGMWLLWNVREYDIVVTSDPPVTTELPGLVASLLGKPWIADIRDLWIDAAVALGKLEAGGIMERAAREFQRLSLQRADRITVTTEATTDRLADSYGQMVDAKSVLVPNGVEVDVFHPTDAEEERVIVYTGNLGSAQDLESCVRAMARLSDDDAVLQLVGTGDEKPALERLAEELSLSSRVEFTGLVPREEVPRILNRAMVGIAPLKDTEALQYAMPTKVYEYMACSLPTLVTGGEHIEQFMEDSGGGVHVENDPDRIAEELDAMFDDESYREELANRGYEYVIERFTRDAIARRLRDELDELVEQNSKQ